MFLKFWLDGKHSAINHYFDFVVNLSDIFQLPQLHKHLNVIGKICLQLSKTLLQMLSTENIRQIRLVLLLLSVFSMLGCESECNKKGPPVEYYSQSVSDAKQKGVFRFEAVADKPVFLLDNEFQLEIKSAWVENAWYRQVYMVGKAPLQKIEGSYQLIIRLNIDTLSKRNPNPYLYFIGKRALDTFVHIYCHRIDTIKVPLLRESSSESESRAKRKAFDTVTFVRRSIDR